MATAEANTETITRTTITLKLSPEEAGALMALTARISGSDEGPRAHTSAVYRALDQLSWTNEALSEAHKRAKSRMVNMAGQAGPVGVHFNK